MAEIIDIRDRLRRAPREEGEYPGTLFRLRLCGPDLHWVGLVGGVLAAAFEAQGFYTAFEDVASSAVSPTLSLRAARQIVTETGGEQPPGLIVAGGDLSADDLRGCDSRTVLLTRGDDGGGIEGTFAGTEVPLRVGGLIAAPLDVAAACAGGAARLLGVIGWKFLEEALREELALSSRDAVEQHLSTALAAYNQLLPWEGIVPEATAAIF